MEGNVVPWLSPAAAHAVACTCSRVASADVRRAARLVSAALHGEAVTLLEVRGAHALCAE